MKFKWEIDRNGIGIRAWYLIEPLGTFINVYPIHTDDGEASFKLIGPAGEKIYSTLQEAKIAGEFMCQWMEDNPIEDIPLESPFPGVDMFLMVPRNCPLP